MVATEQGFSLSASLSSPLILTLALDPRSQAFFDRARERWFPAALNFIPAHVTLFHHLPGDGLPILLQDLVRECALSAPMGFTVNGIRFLGRGVAYALETPGAAALRAHLAAAWHDMLTKQDRQGWRPHVTIQNKVLPEQARALHRDLMQEFAPFEGTATGLHLWRYLGGPWRHENTIPFGAERAE